MSAISAASQMHHLFVDYENVHELSASIFGTKNLTLTLLLGAHQKKLDAEVVEKLLMFASTTKLVRLTSSGANALDFTLAYYLGRAVSVDPLGHYHIVSKDKGYDPLISHLLDQGVKIERHPDYAFLTQKKPRTAKVAKPKKSETSEPDLGLLFETPAAKPARPPRPVPPPPAPSAQPARIAPVPIRPVAKETLEKVLVFLRKNQARNSLPKRKETLASTLLSHLGKETKEATVEAILNTLCANGQLVIGLKNEVTYHL